MSSYLVVDDDCYHGKHGKRGERRSQLEPDQIWHLVRHPLDVIGSLAHAMHVGWWRWQERHTGIAWDMQPAIERAGRFWLAWNRLIEPQTQHRVQVERVSSVSVEIGDTPGAQRVPLAALDVVTAAFIRKKAEWYGYDLEGM